MRNRKNRVRFRLNDKEYARFKRDVEASGLTAEVFFRKLIAGTPIEPKPCDELHALKARVCELLNKVDEISNSQIIIITIIIVLPKSLYMVIFKLNIIKTDDLMIRWQIHVLLKK